MGEELADVAQAVRVKAVRRGIGVLEDLFAVAGVDVVDLAESLRQESVEFFVGAMLCTCV